MPMRPTLLLLLFPMIFLGCEGREKPTGAGAPIRVSPKAPGTAPEVANGATNEGKLLQTILAAKDLSVATAGYGALFKSASPDELRRLQRNNSATIAIQAAWEEVELTIPEKPDNVVRPDRDKLTWFLRFLEQRAHVQAPKWWVEAVLNSSANCRHAVSGSWPKEADLPIQATFDKQDGKSVVRIRRVSVPIPDDLRETLSVDQHPDAVCTLITDTRCFIAVHDSIGLPYRLACVERSSAKIRWVADVWASCWADGGSGMPRQRVEVTEQGKRIVVFGTGSYGFHVEAFRVEDGVNVLRFGNAYSRRSSATSSP